MGCLSEEGWQSKLNIREICTQESFVRSLYLFARQSKINIST